MAATECRRHVHRAAVGTGRISRVEDRIEPHQTETGLFRSGPVARSHVQDEPRGTGGEPRTKVRASRFPDPGVVQVLRDRVRLVAAPVGRDRRGPRVHRAPVRGPWRVRVLAEPLRGGQPRAVAPAVAGHDAEPVPRGQRASGHRRRRPTDTEHAGPLGVRAGLHGRHFPGGIRGTPAPDGARPVRRGRRVSGDGRREHGLFGRPGRAGKRGVAAARLRVHGRPERAAGRWVARAEDVHRVRVQHHMPRVPAVLSVRVGGAQETGHQQTRQLGGVRRVHRLQGQVVGPTVRSEVFLGGRPRRRRHVPFVADT